MGASRWLNIKASSVAHFDRDHADGFNATQAYLFMMRQFALERFRLVDPPHEQPSVELGSEYPDATPSSAPTPASETGTADIRALRPAAKDRKASPQAGNINAKPDSTSADLEKRTHSPLVEIWAQGAVASCSIWPF